MHPSTRPSSQYQTVFFIFRPDPHFTHLPCGDGSEFYQPCPATFWRYPVGCYEPNFGPTLNAGFDSCVYDPIPLGETCENIVFLSCRGYTPNIFNFTEFLVNNPDFPYGRPAEGPLAPGSAGSRSLPGLSHDLSGFL
jgi:hypothetical protein